MPSSEGGDEADCDLPKVTQVTLGPGFLGICLLPEAPQQGHVAPPMPTTPSGKERRAEALPTFWIPSTEDDSSVVRVGFDGVNHLLQLVYALTGIICGIIEKRRCAHVHYVIW